MGRHAEATAEQVFAAADELHGNGIGPTVRAIRQLLGNVGSMGTITKHLQKWREKNEGEKDAGPRVLPAKVNQTIFDVIDQEVKRAHADLVEKLREARLESLALAEDNEQAAQSNQDLQSRISSLECANAGLEGRISQLLEGIAEARAETAVERRNAELQRIERAIAAQRIAALESVERDLKQLRSDLEEQRTGRIRAEQAAAVLDSQKADVVQRLSELRAASRHAPDGNNRPNRRRQQTTSAPDHACAGFAEENVGRGRDAHSSALSAPDTGGDPRQMTLC